LLKQQPVMRLLLN